MSDQKSRRTLALALTTSLAAIALVGVLLPCHVAAVEREIAVGSLPKNIRQALGDVDSKVDIEKVEQETRNGAMTYAISIAAGEAEFELTLDAAGRLLSVETEDADDGDDKEVDDEDEAEDDQNEDDDNEHEHSYHAHSASQAKTQVVDFNTLPKAAQLALSKEAGQAAIEEIEREEKQGRVIFETLWNLGGIKHEASVTSNGVLLNSEQVAAAESVPADVRRAAEAGLAGRGEISYERKLLVVFEAEAGAGKQKEELLLSPLGIHVKLLKLKRDLSAKHAKGREKQ